MVKGDAERQRLQREELEQELQKICQQEQLLTTENEIVKVCSIYQSYGDYLIFNFVYVLVINI